jgi:hypothetical protein
VVVQPGQGAFLDPRAALGDHPGPATEARHQPRQHVERALERALRAAEVDWTLAIEAEGWPLTLHFVTLGVGLSIVNGCVLPPPGFTSREITDLPRVPYYAVHLPDRTTDARLAELLTAIRLGLA